MSLIPPIQGLLRYFKRTFINHGIRN
ncbi:hypothetical protein PFDG_05396 [Plasmodium falciparum Dd2]|uniref:Uncharacterized protein n=1 Tax=Plasmodium falciparum (isolate Dd2) TaxID=57267 RepID=A0A0L7LX34_PLAF4|nr:hypothetical protein PFDG_05396 [Plasmodium falciparum Dd2]